MWLHVVALTSTWFFGGVQNLNHFQATGFNSSHSHAKSPLKRSWAKTCVATRRCGGIRIKFSVSTSENPCAPTSRHCHISSSLRHSYQFPLPPYANYLCHFVFIGRHSVAADSGATGGRATAAATPTIIWHFCCKCHSATHLLVCVCAGKNMLILVPVTMVATTAVAR